MVVQYELMDYIPFIPPSGLQKSNYEFTKMEARQYYDWFTSNFADRADYLRTYIAKKGNIKYEKLDLSPASLVIVWEWLLSVAAVEAVSEEELEEVKKAYVGAPQHMLDEIVRERSFRLSTTTEYVLRDIGMYVAKMFIDNYPILRWNLKLKPKSDVHVNLPVIAGFVDGNSDSGKPYCPELEPIELARTPALKLIRRPFESPKNTDLLELCEMWMEWIPQ